MCEIVVEEVVTTKRKIGIDPKGGGFYASVMHDNHTFTQTKPGTLVEVEHQMESIVKERGLALFTLHHESLDRNTKLITSRNIDNMRITSLWMKPYNPFLD